MTGFGKAECLLPDKKLTIEVRALNSKQLDTYVRIPALYREKELEIRQIISGELMRGKVECNFHYEVTGEGAAGSVNTKVVKHYYGQLSEIAADLGISPSVELLSATMRLPDTIHTEKPELDDEEWDAVKDGLRQALRQVNGFRHQEGEALYRDLQDRVGAIRDGLEAIDPLESERVGKIRDRIGGNLREFLKGEELDENRFEQELIYYLEKLDISEEKVRLANHCSYFLETLEEPEAVGKKLGFISQEMGREINTLGSKASHAGIQRNVVAMKDELERIKEQVLNVL